MSFRVPLAGPKVLPPAYYAYRIRKRASRRGESDGISALGPKVRFPDLRKAVQRLSDTPSRMILPFLENKRLACTRALICETWASLGAPLASLTKATRLQKHGIYSVCEGCWKLKDLACKNEKSWSFSHFLLTCRNHCKYHAFGPPRLALGRS